MDVDVLGIQTVATLIAAYGFLMLPLGWGLARFNPVLNAAHRQHESLDIPQVNNVL